MFDSVYDVYPECSSWDIIVGWAIGVVVDDDYLGIGCL